MLFLVKNSPWAVNFSGQNQYRFALNMGENGIFINNMPYMGVRTDVPQSPGKFYYAQWHGILTPDKGLKVSFNILNLKYLVILKKP